MCPLAPSTGSADRAGEAAARKPPMARGGTGAAPSARPNSSFAGRAGSSGLASGGSGTGVRVPGVCAAAPATGAVARAKDESQTCQHPAGPDGAALSIVDTLQCRRADENRGRTAGEAVCRTRYASAAAVILVAVALAATAAPALAAEVLVRIELEAQRMIVRVDGEVRYVWPVSTARRGMVTPAGVYRPQGMARWHRSTLYHGAPMPHSIFFSGNYAIHGTTEVAASVGAPRMAASASTRLTPGHCLRWSVTPAGPTPGSRSHADAASGQRRCRQLRCLKLTPYPRRMPHPEGCGTRRVRQIIGWRRAAVTRSSPPCRSAQAVSPRRRWSPAPPRAQPPARARPSACAPP